MAQPLQAVYNYPVDAPLPCQTNIEFYTEAWYILHRVEEGESLIEAIKRIMADDAIRADIACDLRHEKPTRLRVWCVWKKKLFVWTPETAPRIFRLLHQFYQGE